MEDAENSLDTFNRGCCGGIEQAWFTLEALQQSTGLLHLILEGRSVAPVQHPAQDGTKLSLVCAKTVQAVIY